MWTTYGQIRRNRKGIISHAYNFGCSDELDFQLNFEFYFRVGFSSRISSWILSWVSSWIFELDFRVGFRGRFSSWISSWIYEMDLRDGFSSWIFELGFFGGICFGGVSNNFSVPTRGYEFYLRLCNSISHEFASLTRDTSSFTIEDKIHIHKRACNILFLIHTPVKKARFIM